MEYRFYFIDTAAHIVGPAIDAECADDARALSKAVELGRTPVKGATNVEVWCLARCIGKVPVEI